MARNRIVNLKKYSSERMGNISFPAESLWLGLNSFADDYGVIENNAIKIFGDIWSIKKGADLKLVIECLNELILSGLIFPVRYFGKNYFIIYKFETYQNVNRPSKRRFIEAEHQQTLSDTISEWLSDTVSDTINETINDTISETLSECLLTYDNCYKSKPLFEYNKKHKVLDAYGNFINAQEKHSVSDSVSVSVSDSVSTHTHTHGYKEKENKKEKEKENIQKEKDSVSLEHKNTEITKNANDVKNEKIYNIEKNNKTIFPDTTEIFRKETIAEKEKKLDEQKAKAKNSGLLMQDPFSFTVEEIDKFYGFLGDKASYKHLTTLLTITRSKEELLDCCKFTEKEKTYFLRKNALALN